MVKLKQSGSIFQISKLFPDQTLISGNVYTGESGAALVKIKLIKYQKLERPRFPCFPSPQ